MKGVTFRIFLVLASILTTLFIGSFLVADSDNSNSAVNAFNHDAYELYRSQQVNNLDDLIANFDYQQMTFVPIAPPDPEFVLSQGAGLLLFDPKDFPADFLTGLVVSDSDGIPVYPITIAEDPITREKKVYNSTGKEITVVAPRADYSWDWIALDLNPSLYTSGLSKDYITDYLQYLDPSRVVVNYELILKNDLIKYLLKQSYEESLSSSSDGGGIIMMAYNGPAVTNLKFTCIERKTNGMMVTLAYPFNLATYPTDCYTNKVEFFVCSNLLDLTCVSKCVTNVSSTTNWIEWTDTEAVGTNIPIRFYFAGNADLDSDGDGLKDAQERYVYHSTSTNRDSDEDGLVDGYSGVVTTNSYPGGAHTNGGLYVEGEMTWNTDPNLSDTDDDGMEDGWEVSNGHDPLNVNDPPNVRGVITYTGGQTGNIRVIAVTSSNSWATNYSNVISSPGNYRIPHLHLTNYWLKAYRDSNGNGTNDTMEAWGYYSTNSITITNKVIDINLTLTDPDGDGDSLPDWWEVYYFGSTATYNGAHDPDSDTYNNLEEYTAGTDPTDIASHPWNVSGTISYDGTQTGKVIIIASTSEVSWVGLEVVTNASTGAYTITHLPPNANYWVKAWRDTDGSGSNTYWEACGSSTSNPVYVNNNVTNINVTLTNPDTDGDGIADYWELANSMDPLTGGRADAIGWWMLDESSGTNAVDSSGNGNTGILYNAVSSTWTGGVISNALSFDGSSYVLISDSDFLKPDNVSVSLWIRPATNYSSGTTTFFSKKQTGTSTGYALTYESGSLKFLICATGDKSVTYACTLTNGVWHHISGTYGGAYHRLYLDGVLKVQTNYNWGTGSGAMNQGAVNPRIGASADSTPTNYFSGIIDDVAVFNRELTSNEVYGISELGADSNADGVSNFEQSKLDADNDGIVDSWEIQNFGNLSRTPNITVTSGGTIQAGIDASSSGNLVLVKRGTYKGAGNTDLTFSGKNITLISEAGAESTIIDCERTAQGFRFENSENTNAVLSGFTVCNGYAGLGGAVYCSQASPTLRYNTFANNLAVTGGAVYVIAANPVISDCTIVSNTAYSAGGGISAEALLNCVSYFPLQFESIGSSPTIQGCEIKKNYAADGAGIYLSDTTPFADLADADHSTGTPVIVGCKINNNTAQKSCGISSMSGSAIAAFHFVKPTIVNTSICRNKGNGVNSSDAKLILRNATIGQNKGLNTPYSYGSGVSVVNGFTTSYATLINCIVRTNAPQEDQIFMPSASLGSCTVSYTCYDSSHNTNGISNYTSYGSGNTNVNPLICRDGHIQKTSPCIGAGTTNSAPFDDMDGETRSVPVDMGCDEFKGTGDADDLPDWFEETYFGDETSGDSAADTDGDGLTNLQEYIAGTNPKVNPGDSDGDGLNDDKEEYYNTDPFFWDSDDDGLPDGWEIEHNFDPAVANSPTANSDGDAWTDEQEYIQGTDPWDNDTDNDFKNDSEDADPLDPTNTATADSTNTVTMTLTVGDSSGSHSEMWVLSVDTFVLRMPHVSETSYVFTKTFRLPRGKDYQGYLQALGDSKGYPPDGDYDADVAGEGIIIEDPMGVLGGYHNNSGFTSGMRYFTVHTGSSSANTNNCSNPSPENSNTIDPINTQNGNVTLNQTDIVIPCPGLSLSFERYYNSRSTFTNSSLGAGWANSYEIFLETRTNATYKGVYGNWQVLNMPQGQQHWFQSTNGIFKSPRDNNLVLASSATNYVVSLPGSYSWAFSTNGVLLNMTEAFGNTLTFTYTNSYPNQRISRIDHNNGQYLSFTFTNSLWLSRVNTPSNNFYVSYSYNASNELTNVVRNISSGTQVTRYLYDASTHSLTQKVNALNEKFNYGYFYTNLLGKTVSYGTSMWLNTNYYQHTVNYTNQGVNKTQVTYARNGTSQSHVYTYDPIVNMIKSQLGPNGTNLGIRYTINTALDTTEETIFDDSIGSYAKTLRSYDTNHNVTYQGSSYNVSSTTNWWSYTWNNTYKLPASITDPAGSKVEFSYTNGLVSQASVYYASGQCYNTTFGYTTAGLLSAVTNANQHYIRYYYNSYGFQTSSVPQLGPTVSYAYNILGSVTNISLPWSSGTRNTKFTVNELGWTTNIIFPDGTTNKFWFDSLGNVTNYLNANSRTTRYTYAPTRKLSSVVREVGNGTWATNTFTYDNQFNTLRITDERGRGVESYVLDIQDRPITITNLEAQTMSVVYGVGDFVKKITRFDGTSVSNDFNYDGRISKTTYSDATNFFSYYGNGLLMSASNRTGSVISNFFDMANRLTSSVSAISNLASTVNYTYFPAGQVSNVVSIGVTNTYALDNADRISTLQTPATTFNFLYNSYNGLVSAVSNSIVNVAYGFDTMDRATNITWRKTSGGTIQKSFAYRFSNVGMITNVIYENGERAVYAYDGLDRLTNVSLYNSVGTLTNYLNYAYDLAGNRTNVMGTGVTNKYVYSGTGNKLVTWGANTTNLYDTAGNITNIKYSATFNLGLTYNQQYQVTSIKTNGVVCESYQYDSLGRRIKIANGSETNFCVYDGANVVADLNAAGTVQRTYVWAGIDNLLSMTSYTGGVTKTYYPLKDHLGSIVAMVDSSTGNIVENYRYDAFGRTTVMNASSNVLTQSAIGNRYCWTGREYSYKTTLYFHRSRFYDCVTGRWISPDKIGIAGGGNLYVAFNNAPTVFVDPSGLCPEEIKSISWWDMYVGGWQNRNMQTVMDYQQYFYDNNLLFQWYSDAVNFIDTLGGFAPPVDPNIQYGMPPSRPSRMNQNRPRGVDRVERPHIPGQEPHVHYANGTASTQSGAIHDAHRGIPNPSNRIRAWLESHEWIPPRRN